MEATTDSEPRDAQNNSENTPTTANTVVASAPAFDEPSRNDTARLPPEESGPSSHTQLSVKPNKVYIGGLPDDTREADLQDCFGKFGPITSIELKTGYGFVEFTSRSAAEKAVATYHEGSFLGNIIRVELSHGGGKSTAKLLTEPGACFKCGQQGHWARECPNHVVVLQRRGWTDRSTSHSSHHTRSESFRSVPGAPLPTTRDDYRSTTRRQEDYGTGGTGGRDYNFRDREPRRPGSPYYDYNRPVAPVSHGYDDRRYPTGPSRASYPPDRPPSPYGASPRVTSTIPPSRDYVRGYERPSASYDPRAFPPSVAPYTDSGSYTRRSDPYPSTLQSMPNGQPYSAYAVTRDYPSRRSPPPAPRLGGRYQEYNGHPGYERPYERRRSASPPTTYREGGSQPPLAHAAGNGYSRTSATPYGRSQPYGPGYNDRGPSGPRVHTSHSASMVNSSSNNRAGERDYRPYRG